MFQKMKSRKGFTLIEMLVVIAIIAVLVAIVVPVVGNSTTKARAAADAANLRTVAAAAAISYMDNNQTIKSADLPSGGSVAAKSTLTGSDNSLKLWVSSGTSEIIATFGGYTISDFSTAAETGTLTASGTISSSTLTVSGKTYTQITPGT